MTTLEVPNPNGLAALPTRKEIDGYDAAGLEGWLRRTCPALSAAEQWTHEARLMVGYALWQLRNEQTEAAYTTATRAIAEAAGVNRSTLWRWRTAAQEEYGLELPAGSETRSGGQAQREDRQPAPTPHPGPIEASAREIPNSDLGLDVDPAAAPIPSSTVPRSPRAEPQGTQEAMPVDDNNGLGPASVTVRRIVQSLVTFSVEELAASCDLPALRDARERLERAETVRASAMAPKAAAAPAANGKPCPHPRHREQKLPYGIFCGECKVKIR